MLCFLQLCRTSEGPRYLFNKMVVSSIVWLTNALLLQLCRTSEGPHYFFNKMVGTFYCMVNQCSAPPTLQDL